MVNKDSHAYNTGVLLGMELNVEDHEATLKYLPNDQVQAFKQGWNDGIAQNVMSFIMSDLRNLPPHLQKDAVKAIIGALVNRL